MAREALEIARTLKLPQVEAQAHECLSAQAEAAGALADALRHARAAAAIRTAAAEAERRSGLAALHAAFAVERAEREAEVQRLRSVELAAALRAAEQASEAKSRFLSHMSHELRTPLNAVLGFARLLKEPFGADRRVEWADNIETAGQHLLGLITDILDLSKMEAGGLVVRPEPCELVAIVQASLRLQQAAAEQKGVHLAAVLPAPAVRVLADPQRLRQILLNLLSNAIKFTPRDGAVRVALARRGGGWRLSVADTGVGMAEAELPVALTPFGQVANTYAKAHEGTGLGLPITKRLVELHGWGFQLASAPGQGTRVDIDIPD